jgi:UDP-N-acetylmuramate dehydrogenase
LPSADHLPALQMGVPLAPRSSLAVGGAARWFVRAACAEDVAAAHRWCDSQGAEMLVLGSGTNVVIADEGFGGLVVQIDLRGMTMEPDGETTLLRASAGEPWDRLVEMAVSQDLAGLECLSGIPGSVGGTPIQNVGAYGQEVSGTIESVTVFDRAGAALVTLDAAACRFAYRTSRFRCEDAGRFVVCEVAFRLRKGPATVAYPDLLRYFDAGGVRSPSLSDVRSAVLTIRRRKGMVYDPGDPDTASVGSFFTNPVVGLGDHERISSIARESAPAFPAGSTRVKVPAAWLIERAGFVKGIADGRVGLSTRHPLAIVNRGGARARDVLRLASRIQRAVADRFGVWLRAEPVFVGFGDDPEVRCLQSGPPGAGRRRRA